MVESRSRARQRVDRSGDLSGRAFVLESFARTASMAEQEDSAKPTTGSGETQGTGPSSTVGQFVAFLGENKKWWLIPVLAALVLFAGLVLLSRTTASPFVYTLF
jgi:hypothetical protein